MPKINVVAGFIPASLVGTMWAGTRPAPTKLNNDKHPSSNDKANVVAGFIPALLVGMMRAGTRPAPTTHRLTTQKKDNPPNVQQYHF